MEELKKAAEKMLDAMNEAGVLFCLSYPVKSVYDIQIILVGTGQATSFQRLIDKIEDGRNNVQTK